MKTGNKKTIRYEAIQGQILKKFKDKEGFIENERLSRSTVYFKFGLYKSLKKFPALKNSSLSSNILEIILNLLQQFVKGMKNYSHRIRTAQMVLLITIVFNFFLVLL